MKSLYIFLLLYSFCVFCYAENYIVYSVKGNVWSNDNVPVKRGTILSSSDILKIEENSKLVIVTEIEKQMYTIHFKSHGKLEGLLKNQECNKRNLSDAYLSFVKKSIFGTSDVEDKNYMQSAGTAYRKTDSIYKNIIIQHNDSLK